jgi:DNA-binding IclR family transcriptional regulator
VIDYRLLVLLALRGISAGTVTRLAKLTGLDNETILLALVRLHAAGLVEHYERGDGPQLFRAKPAA